MTDFLKLLQEIDTDGLDSTLQKIQREKEELDEKQYFAITQKIARNIEQKTQELKHSFIIDIDIIQPKNDPTYLSCTLQSSESNQIHEDLRFEEDSFVLSIEDFFNDQFARLSEENIDNYILPFVSNFSIEFSPNKDNTTQLLKKILPPDMFPSYLSHKISNQIEQKNPETKKPKI